MSSVSTAAHALACSPDVVIVGAGPAGLTAAAELARRGVSSHVVERYEHPSRDYLFNLAAPVLDALDGAGFGRVVQKMDPLQQAGREFRALEVHPERARGDAADLLAGYGGGDDRPWGRMEIARFERELEHTLRHDIVPGSGGRRFADLVRITRGATVERVEQDARGVAVHLAGQRDAIRGAFVVNASGGKQIPGMAAPPVTSGPAAWFTAGVYPGVDHAAVRRVRNLSRDGVPVTTLAMDDPHRSLAWVQHPDPTSLDAAQLHEHVARHAGMAGMQGRMLADHAPHPVRMQLGMCMNAVHGPHQRELLVGNMLRSPYFPSSTGAATAAAFDAPQVADAVATALERGDHTAPFATYASRVRDANRQIHDYAADKLAADLAPAAPRT